MLSNSSPKPKTDELSQILHVHSAVAVDVGPIAVIVQGITGGVQPARGKQGKVKQVNFPVTVQVTRLQQKPTKHQDTNRTFK